jgi:tRNA(Ile)-lysidine synthase
LPVTAAVFRAALQPLWPDGARAAAVAVSGGPDSLALALLAHSWAQAQGVCLTALTVDHGLRQNSAAEAQQVAAWLAARRIPHQILRWDGPKPTANLQALARKARYDLLTGWCNAHRVPVLLVGHHADDQIETFLLRLGRGSGLKGLAGMRAAEAWNGVPLLRPLLGISRAALRETLIAAGQPWLEDPSNHDPRFSRSPVRELAVRLPAAGIPPQRVLLGLRNLQRASAAIDAIVTERLQHHCTVRPTGDAVLAPTALHGPDELALRTLATLLQHVGGAGQTGRLVALEALLQALRQPAPLRRTLQGCLVRRESAGDAVQFCREPAAVTARISAADGGMWDNRFRITLAAAATNLQIAALGADGWRQVRATRNFSCRVPDPVRLTLPALWRGDTLLAVSLLGWALPGWADSYTAVFAPLPHPAIFKGAELTYI